MSGMGESERVKVLETLLRRCHESITWLNDYHEGEYGGTNDEERALLAEVAAAIGLPEGKP